MRRIVLSILALTIILLTYSGCTIAKGSIIIKESISGTKCAIEFLEWSGQNKCELSLDKDDELQVVIACESGNVALEIRSKSGVKAYTGIDLQNCSFTVQVPESNEYVITIIGKRASGSISVEKIS
ncbi:MAG: hypothetical protein ACOX8I_08800 [Bacillota bacterium]|jgi:hypothetical protein